MRLLFEMYKVKKIYSPATLVTTRHKIINGGNNLYGASTRRSIIKYYIICKINKKKKNWSIKIFTVYYNHGRAIFLYGIDYITISQ